MTMPHDDIQSGDHPDAAGSTKTKVFVSYSRRNRQRVSRLHEMLESHQDIIVFRDTDDILPTEEWKPRLENLIRSADCLIFALSPHSAKSEVCRWEVELAESLNKRIIPVVIRDVKGEVPAALSKINYIFFTTKDDLRKVFGKIVEAINTDIEWIREHTRLAELANRWKSTRHQGAQPLRGDELSDAEQWLASQPRQAPNPTEAHRKFIYESRKSAIRRSRQGAFAALLAAVVLAGLAAFSYLSYKEANSSFILALLTKADQLLAEELPAKVLVVAGAIDRRGWFQEQLERMGLFVSDDDESVRIRTLARLAGPASANSLRSWKYSSAATTVAFNRAGNRFAIGYNNGEVHIRSVEGDGPAQRLARNSGRIWGLEFGPNDKWLVSSSSQEVLLWDLEKKTALRYCETDSQITALAFDPRGRYLAWTIRDGRIIVLDLKSRARTEFAEFRTAPWAAAFSPSGAYFVSSSGDGTVAIRNTADWTLHKTFKTDRFDLVDVSINKDETRLATSSLAGPVDIWDITADKPETARVTLSVPADKRWKLQYSPDGRWLALSSWQGTVRFWDADTLQYRGTIDGHDLRVNDIAFSGAGSLFLTAAESGMARLWSLENLHPMFETRPGDSRETLVGKYSSDGTKFASGGKDGVAILFRIDASGGLTKICGVDHPNWVYSISFSADSKRVASVGLATGRQARRGNLKIWDAEDCRVLRELQGFSKSNVGLVAYSPAGGLMAWATNAGEIWFTDGEGGGDIVKLPQIHTAGIGEIDFSADGRFLVSGGLDARVIVWDVEKRDIYRELRGHNHGEYVWTVRFAANGSLLASSGTEGRILVWDIAKPPGSERIKELALPGGANRLAFNHSGTVLAVGSGNRAISMWSTSDWRKTFQLNALVGIRSVFDFHPKRGDLAFDGAEGLIRIYPNKPAAETYQPGKDVILDGMDVFFDRSGINTGAAAGFRTIHAPPPGCQ